MRPHQKTLLGLLIVIIIGVVAIVVSYETRASNTTVSKGAQAIAGIASILTTPLIIIAIVQYIGRPKVD